METKIKEDETIRMHNPSHLGEIFSGLWLNPMGLSVIKAALALGVSRKTHSKIVIGNSGISRRWHFVCPLSLAEAEDPHAAHGDHVDLEHGG